MNSIARSDKIEKLVSLMVDNEDLDFIEHAINICIDKENNVQSSISKFNELDNIFTRENIQEFFIFKKSYLYKLKNISYKSTYEFLLKLISNSNKNSMKINDYLNNIILEKR